MHRRESRSPPRKETEPAPQAAPPPDVAKVMALQHSAGNRAVARSLGQANSLARQPASAPTETPADLDTRYHFAIAHGDWTEAANLLEIYPPEEMEQVAAEVTDTDQLVQFQFMANLGGRFRAGEAIAAVLSRPPHAEHIRVQKLEHDWANARSTEDWYELAKLTCTFSEPDIEKRLAMLHLHELQALVEETKGPHSAELVRLTEPAERHRARKHLEMCRFAIDNGQWLFAVTLLNGLSDSDQDTWVAGLTDPQVTAIAPFVYMMFPDQNRLYSRVNFRQHKSDLASAHPAVAGAMTTGSASPGVAVAGGTVTTSANDTDSSGTSGWFGQDYSGPDAANMGWLQFLAREAEKFDDKGNSLGFDTSQTTYAANQAEPRHWGTASEPYWTVDTAGATVPFYDSPNAAGARFAGASSVTQQAMYDRPDPNTQVSAHAFDDTWFWEADVAKVVMRFHFVDYLVHGRAVVYKSTMDVVWSITPATKGTTTMPRTNTPGAAGPTDKLSAPHFAALLRRFPNWRYFGHE